MCLSIPILLLGALIDDFRRTEVALRRATASVLQARDQERRRIARELHDSTGQNLIAGILMAKRIHKIVPAAIVPLIVKLEVILQQSLREVRTVSYLLHPPLLDDLGLELALRDFVDGYCERSGITVTLLVPEDFARLPAEVELVLFRVIQEALTNVARHSKSPSATISLKRTRNARGTIAELAIEDFGDPTSQPYDGSLFAAGRKTEQYRYGVGLTSMQERLAQIGGDFNIRQEGGITYILATIPLAPGGEDVPAAPPLEIGPPNSH